MRWLLGISLCLLAAPGVAQPEAPTEADGGKVKVLALSLKAQAGVEPETSQLLDDLVTVSLSDYAAFEVISDADVQQLVELEADRAAAGCDMDSSCLAEIAGAMGAQYVVSGRIGKIGSRLSLTFNLYDSLKAKSVDRVNRIEDDLDAVADGIPGAIDELVTPLLEERGLPGREGARVRSSGQSEPAGEPAVSAAVPDDERPADEPSMGEAEEGFSAIWWLVPAGLAGLGAATLVAGAGADFTLCAIGGCDGVLFVEDMVGPAIMAAGVGGLLFSGAVAAVLLVL